MTNKQRNALPLTLALLIGLGAGAVWRAGGVAESQHDEHADHDENSGGADDMPGLDMGDMDMPDMDMSDMAPAAENVSYAINLANDTCPVMGNETDGEVYIHWEGLRVQFCCVGCEDGFLADPEGSLKEAGVDPSAALEAMRTLRDAEGEERTGLLEELSSRFHVVEVKEGGDSR